MSYFLPALEVAVYSRLTGDTATGGLLDPTNKLIAQHPAGATTGIGIYNTVVPPAQSGTVFPLIVFQTEVAGQEDSMRTRVRRVSIAVDIWVDRSPAVGTYAPIARGMAILNRIEGDWDEQTFGTGPTYGLDRWQPDVTSTGWTADAFYMTNLSAAHTEEQYHWRYEIEGLVSKTATASQQQG